jgi:MFS transporter, DHA1 family, inner membrane transport protein
MRTTGDRVETTSRYTLRTWFGLVVLCFGAAVTLLNMAVLSPLLRAIGVEFGTSDATTGQLATLGSLVGVIASLVATPWMDRWSRRTWLRLEGSVVLVATVVSALAPSFGWLMAGRVLASCGAAVIMANCLTGARELFRDPVWRNRAIGIIVSATTFAFILGMPLVTQIEARLGWRIAMGSMAVPVVLLLAGTFVLPPSPRHPRMTVRPHPLAAFQAVLGNGRTRCLLVVLGLNLGLYAGWLVYFGAYTIDVFAVSATVLSLLFFLSGATELVANNLTPPLMRRFDPVSILYVMLASVAAALLLTGIAVTTIPAALLVAIVVLNGTASAYIAANALLLEGEVSHPGAVMSVASAFIGIGTALGPFVAGWALANSGSFEAAYRTLGLLAPVSMVALWLGTRRRAPVPVIERA